MNLRHWAVAAFAVVIAALQIGGNRAGAGCPCQGGGGAAAVPMSDPQMSPYSSVPLATGMPMSGMPSVNGMPGNGMTMNGMSSTAVSPPASYGYPPGALADGTVAGVGPGFSGTTATSWQPPPGTVGRTYQMKSRPVPVKMHPRAAIVDVRVTDAKMVRVHDTNVYRTQDFLEGFQDDKDHNVWHFTTNPLIPGLSHIYRIEAIFDGPDGETTQERYVRMIMGRVIEIEF